MYFLILKQTLYQDLRRLKFGRLEDLEVDRERQAFKRGNKASGRIINSDGSGQLHRVRYPGQNVQQQQRSLKRDY